MYTVGGCAPREFACASFLAAGRRARKTARAGLPARAAATMPAAAAASAAATALAALATLNAAVARNLTLLTAHINSGARLVSCGRRRSAHCRLRRTWTDIPIPRTTLLIPAALLTPIAIATVTCITTVAPITSASLRAAAITVTTALTTLRAARLSGMFPPAIATPLTTAV